MEISLLTHGRPFCALLILASLDCTWSPRAFASPQAEVTFGPGEKLRLRLDKTISSNTAQVGDRVEAELQLPRPAKVTRVLGVVAAARPGNKPHRIPPRLKLVFNQIVLSDGRTIPMEGSIEINGWIPGYNRKTMAFADAVGMGTLGALIGGLTNGPKGAGVGAAVGASLGGLSMGYVPEARWKDVVIKKGRRFPVELKQEVRLPIVPSPTP